MPPRRAAAQPCATKNPLKQKRGTRSLPGPPSTFEFGRPHKMGLSNAGEPYPTPDSPSTAGWAVVDLRDVLDHTCTGTNL